MTYEFDNYGSFAAWCEENSFDSETEWDIKHEPFKRDLLTTFYIKHKITDVYRSVTALVSNDWGWSNVEVSSEDLTRKVEQVMTEKVSYV